MSVDSIVAPENLQENAAAISNGSGAAAIFAAGIGSFALGLLSVAGDQSASLKKLFSLYNPTGTLSGVTTGAVVVWLTIWAILEWRWRKRNVNLSGVCRIALVLLLLALVLTYPPLADLL